MDHVPGQTIDSSAAHFATDGISAPLSMPNPATAGNLIAVVVTIPDGEIPATSVSSVVDDDGSYTLAKRQTTNGSGAAVEIWYRIITGGSGGGQNLVVTVAGPFSVAHTFIGALEFDGALADQSGLTTNGATTISVTSHPSGSVTPATANNVLVAVTTGGNRTYTGDAAWTDVLIDTRTTFEYRIQSSATAQQHTITSDGNTLVEHAIVAFSGADEGGEPDPSDGASDGTSTVAAVGSALANAASTVAGVATALAVGSALVLATATSNGTSTASATGSALVAATGTSAGAATAQATGSSLTAATAQADGAATVSAVGSSLAAATGTSAGTSTASASSEVSSTGTAAGTGTAAATGSSLATATGTASGTSTATAISGVVSTASAAGTSTAAAVGSALFDASGTAAGTSTATAIGTSLARSTGTSAGSATATATGTSLASAIATAAGTSTASAVGSTAEDVIPDVIVLSDASWTTPTLTSAVFSVPTIEATWDVPTLSDQTFTP